MFNERISQMGIISVLAIVLAIAATVLAFIFIVPEKKRSSFNDILKFVYDALNFKFLFIEKILQALYIFNTVFVILFGFFMLFYVEDSYWVGTKWYGLEGILLMVLGPIAIRIVYESFMLIILLVKNVIQINNKLKNANEDAKDNMFAPPSMNNFQQTYQAPAAQAPVAEYCPACGNKTDGAIFCPNCGNKVK